MIEVVRSTREARTCFCNICSHEWTDQLRPVGRFASLDDLVRRTGLRRDELTTLADIGALNDFTHERRSALYCGSFKSVVSGVPIARVLFPSAEIGAMILPLMMYHQLQMMVSATLAPRQARQES